MSDLRPPSQAVAEEVVGALVAGGVRDVVLAPGSRSAPMAYALVAAEEAGALRLHVGVDERSMGFLALGLAAASGQPVAVVVTSGSAVANLHPAVLEAAHQRAPLVVVSCDRPAELVRRGGSQTTEHLGLFGDPADPGATAGGISRPRAAAGLAVGADPGAAGALVASLLAAARGPLPGPVHLNVEFADPLTPAGSVPEAPGVEATAVADPIRSERRAIVLAGDGATAAELAPFAAAGWPIVAEPTVDTPAGLGAAPALLAALGPDVTEVVVVGRPTLSRQQTALLARADMAVTIVDPPGVQWLDVPGADHVGPADAHPEAAEPAWSERWECASAAAQAELDQVLAEGALEGWTAARLASRVAAAEGGTLVAGASMAIRQLDLAGVPAARVVSNRGLAGIDGTVATALGHALAPAAGPVRVLLGDLTLQHDLGGLVRGELERPASLQLLVLADRGGSIFATLEHGRAEFAGPHERVFATPQRLDLAGIAAGVAARHVVVDNLAQLTAALDGWPGTGGGIEIVEIRLVRQGAAQRRREVQERLVSAVTGAIGGPAN